MFLYLFFQRNRTKYIYDQSVVELDACPGQVDRTHAVASWLPVGHVVSPEINFIINFKKINLPEVSQLKTSLLFYQVSYLPIKIFTF